MVAEPWPGVSAAWSRFVPVPSSAPVDEPGTSHTWHLLDNGPELEARGITPAGTLLCVHGNPTWSYLWRSLLGAASEIERPWRVIAVDQLDMGFSHRTGVFRRLEHRISDLDDLTTALGLTGRVITVGHDWGGVISLGWALEHQDLLAGVVLTNTAVHPAGFDLPAALKLALHPAVHPWGTRTSPAFLKVTHSLASPALAPAVEAAFMAPYRGAKRRTGVANFVADIPADPTHPSWPALDRVSTGIGSLTVPALVLWGPKDPVFSDRYLRDLIGRLPQAQVHRFEGASHLLPEDRDIATPVFDWLAGTTTAESQAPAGSHTTAEYLPMTAELDARRLDTTPAVIDMAPLGSGANPAPASLDWATLATHVDEMAAGLRSIGVQPGDRISLLVPPGIELTTLIYACLRLGAVIVVADAGLGTKGLGRAIKGAGPRFLIGIDRALVGARALGWPGIRIGIDDMGPAKSWALGVENSLAAIRRLGAAELSASALTPAAQFPAPGADTDAAILFTSGSTGPAKGVVYTHRQLSAMRDTLKDTYDLRAGSGLVAGFAPFALLGPALGATSVTPAMDVTSPKTLTAAALADAAVAIGASVIFASPAALANVLATADGLSPRQRGALSGIKLLLSAGAPIPEPLLAKVQELVPAASLHTPYGMTEALPVTDISLSGIREAGTGNGVCVGVPVSGARVAISPFAADGSVAAEAGDAVGVSGEILVSAPHVKDRYDRLWITEKHSSSVPGWHRTGDVGHLDDAGRLWVEGRLGHILVQDSGVRTPVAAEHAAQSVAGVGRAAVVGVGPAGTQAAVVVMETHPPAARPALAPHDLAASVRASVAEHAGMDIAAVLMVPELPTDIRHNSKIDRAALAGWATKALSGGRIHRP